MESTIRNIKLSELFDEYNPIVYYFKNIFKDLLIENVSIYYENELKEFLFYSSEKGWLFYEDTKLHLFYCNYNFDSSNLNFIFSFSDFQKITKYFLEKELNIKIASHIHITNKSYEVDSVIEKYLKTK